MLLRHFLVEMDSPILRLLLGEEGCSQKLHNRYIGILHYAHCLISHVLFSEYDSIYVTKNFEPYIYYIYMRDF